MYSPQASVLDHLESALAIGLFVEKRKLERRRLAGLLREVEPMNIRLKELEEARLKAGSKPPPLPPPLPTPLPPIEPIAPRERKPMSSVLGLQGGAIGAAIEKAKQRLVAKTTEGLGKIDAATAAGEAKIDGVTSNLAAKIEKEIEDQVSDFVTLTNGGPV